MRSIDKLLEEYGESHQNPLNKAIHWLAVPAIVWTVIALLWSIPFPFESGVDFMPVNWAVLVLVLAQIYWFRLSLSLGAGLMIFNLFMIQLTVLMPQLSSRPLWQIALAVFVVAWILQFIGHAIEGKRPSFFKDVQFLLIGPAWLMAFVYRALGIRY
ncbi:MAG: DUF962 domain-containing protein [Xanthomonadales bacterium]|nr:DUF962 domain-containing protein [Gammaproteobacteria bacterium]NNE06449.1 DUF962 domain-containing protein [Xanthomonadales bacterium]NNL95400.1 DUF962 domain-containing protein [Xanthomonadales bacterium]